MISIKRTLLIIAIPITLIIFLSCNGKPANQSTAEAHVGDSVADSYKTVLQNKESIAANKQRDYLGELFATIPFKVKTDNISDFPDGIIPWVSIEKADEAIPNLIDKNKIVINEHKVVLIIDYPLTYEYRANLESSDGFTTEELLLAIREHYLKIYQEEEKTATVKTIAPEKRIGLANRNQTNGEYGIWGHDIGDLVLSEVMVYKTEDGKILLSLGIES